MLDQKYYIINRLFTQVLIIYFTLRALLTFSRGGVVGMILSVLIAFLFFRKIRKDSAIKLAVLASAMVIVFLITNAITNGQLLLRYKGETTGTLAGSREKTLESFSSGRNNFAEVDLYVWADNIILGVGPGRVQFIRYKYGLYDDAPPHTEVTRLLAEDGLFGLAINLILIFWPLYVISRTPSRDMKFIKSILFIFAYATTFHSATRTGLTPLLYGLASMDIMSFDQLKSSPEYDQKI
jgi:O-antigen ligase